MGRDLVQEKIWWEEVEKWQASGLSQAELVDLPFYI